MTAAPLRLGISRCLLGEAVRYDGSHKRDRFLAEVLGRYVEWVPVCPEVEAGLGAPREPMRLVGDAGHPKLITITTGKDKTGLLERFSVHRTIELKSKDLSGYVFKARSPSCGIQTVPLHTPGGKKIRGTSSGLFARAFMEEIPLVPVADEDCLHDPLSGDNFIERVFCYHRWRQRARRPFTRHDLVGFHAAHKYLLLAHSRAHYHQLGRLVAQADRYRSTELTERYGALFMEALTRPATPRKHTNVLRHLVGHLKDRLTKAERDEVDRTIENYRQGLVSLMTPLTILKQHAVRHDVAYLRKQVYLDPHPLELKLRNLVRRGSAQWGSEALS